MTRVKKGKTAHKKREKMLKLTKGFKWGRKSKKRLAKEAITKALTYSFISRKLKKRDFRRLWNVQINAGLRQRGEKYSSFIYKINKKNIELDRKIMAELAENYPKVFDYLVSYVNADKTADKSEVKQSTKAN